MTIAAQPIRPRRVEGDQQHIGAVGSRRDRLVTPAGQYTGRQREHQEGWIRFGDGTVPSDHFRRNVFVSFQEDPVGVHTRHLIGIDCLLWGSDYPHTESTFPRSTEILDDVMKGVPDDERQRMVCANTARIYGFAPPAG